MSIHNSAEDEAIEKKRYAIQACVNLLQVALRQGDFAAVAKIAKLLNELQQA